MSRRRLRVACSSDEDDESPPPPPPPPPLTQPQHHHPELSTDDDIIFDDIDTDLQTVTLNSSNPTPNTTTTTTTNSTATTTTANTNGNRANEPIPIYISDDDLEEQNVIHSDDEHTRTTNHNNNDSSNSSSNRSGYFRVSDSPVNAVLETLGLRLRSEWLDSCLHGLRSSVPGFQGMDDSAKAKLCFEQFLRSDMNRCGAGVLPPDVHALHSVDLKGPFVLQVDEIVNLSCPLRGRYQNAAAGIKRCLKLSMTDGVQRVFGMEYRPIKDLEVLAPAGLKVVICNVNIRRGLLMLVPEVLEVLGGAVEELEAARQRLVHEINKPPRGQRNRSGEVPPLASRATRAAWPSQNDAVPGNVARNTTVDTTPLQASRQGSTVTEVGSSATNMHRQAFTTPFARNNAEPNTSSALRPQQHNEVRTGTDRPACAPLSVAGQGFTFGSLANDRPRQGFGVSVSRSTTEPSRSPEVRVLGCVTVPQHVDGSPSEIMPTARATAQVTTPSAPTNHLTEDDVAVRGSGNNAEPNTSSAVDMDVEDMCIVDELDHPFILSGDKEFPFTYLVSLSAKCGAVEDEGSTVRGKIKCFMTAVKGFEFRQRDTYELRVYVDDGSLISEILIDHNVVQNAIGYSPREVTSALASSDTKRVGEMKKTMKQFQIFLVNFEGTMLVQMNKTSAVPTAVEMEQGCPASASDAWLLLKRLKSFTSGQPLNPSRFNPINLSP